MPVVLFDPCLNGMLGLSNADLPTLTGDAVYARCPQAEVILNKSEESVTFLDRRPAVLMLCTMLNGSRWIQQRATTPLISDHLQVYLPSQTD
jgi:hypothetical protein